MADAAEALRGEKWRQTAELFGRIEIAVAKGRLSFMEAEGINITPAEKLHIGMMTRSLET